ncbi:MAG TPA: TolC family protein [Candidatus Acidoferrales bacterium]|jgi:outer membrane protein TolC|nr:TolC family protein [Candidatus Acidoferrales bacterium]
MNSVARFAFLWLLVLELAGCAVQRYQEAPLVPATTASTLDSRNLSDPGLQPYVEKSLGHAVSPWPPKQCDLPTLSLIAVYFSPEIQAARARLEEADAAITTAGARPNPAFDFSPGVPSPYLLTTDVLIPLETRGKRGLRLRSARSLDEAARLDLADTEWRVHSAVRKALLDYLLASRSLDLYRSEERVRDEQVKLLQERFIAGDIPRPELDLARIELSKSHLAINTAEGLVAQAKASLAAAMTIPAGSLDGIEFAWSDLDSPPDAQSVSVQEVRRDAVVDRLDVRRALLQYAATESDLQLEIAKQYPDVQIGPGYTYEEKDNFFTVGLSVTLPIFNRNRGPIAEAEARRKEAAAAFLQKQAQVLGDSERAFATYSAALNELREAGQSLRQLQDTQLRMTQLAVRAGEEDRLTLNGVQLENAAVARAQLDALGRAQTALGDLEDALQRPLTASDKFPVNPESGTSKNAALESSR